MAGEAGLTAEECARLMNHAYGSRIEADHYDRSENTPIKVEGMRKWALMLDNLLA